MTEYNTILLDEIEKQRKEKPVELTPIEETIELMETYNDSTDFELPELILTILENGMIDENAYDAINEFILESDIDFSEKRNLTPGQKKKGYVVCPNGKIRKRGACSKPIDKKKSRAMKKARKTNKAAFTKGAKKAKLTKRTGRKPQNY